MYYVLFSRSVQDKSKETRASVGYKSPTTDTAAALHCLLLLFTQYELVSIQYLNFSLGIKTYTQIMYTLMWNMHGWSDSTVIERRQQQLGRMADFLPPVTFSVFDL